MIKKFKIHIGTLLYILNSRLNFSIYLSVYLFLHLFILGMETCLNS